MSQLLVYWPCDDVNAREPPLPPMLRNVGLLLLPNTVSVKNK